MTTTDPKLSATATAKLPHAGTNQEDTVAVATGPRSSAQGGSIRIPAAFSASVVDFFRRPYKPTAYREIRLPLSTRPSKTRKGHQEW